MAQTLTDRVEAIKNTPDTGEQVQISEINSAFDKFDNHFVPAALLAFTGAQSPASAVYTDSDYNQVRHDSYAARAEGPMANIATNEITIRKAGPYDLDAGSGLTTNATGQRRLAILVDGVEYVNDERTATGGGPCMLSCSITMLLAVGQVIKTQVRQTSGVALAITGNAALNGVHLSAHWHGSVVEV